MITIIKQYPQQSQETFVSRTSSDLLLPNKTKKLIKHLLAIHATPSCEVS